MPRVPTVEGPTQGLSVPNLPNASPNAFGYQVGAGMQAFGRGVGIAAEAADDYVMEQQKLANEVEARDLLIEYNRRASDLDVNFSTLQGSQPGQQFAAYRQSLEETRKEVISRTQNPMVRRMLENGTLDHYESALRRGAMHVATQTREYRQTQTKALLGIELERAKRVGEDDIEFWRIMGSAEALAERLAKDSGAPPEEAKLQIAQFKNQIISERLQSVATNNPQAAANYLKKAGKEVDFQTREKLTAYIDNRLKEKSADDISEAVLEGRSPVAGKGVLDFIAQSEGTAGGVGGGYDVTLDHGRWSGGDAPGKLTSMTVDEVLAMQARMRANPQNRAVHGDPSSAVGRYQIVGKTLEGLKREMGLTGDEKFSPELQDKMARVLIARRGRDASELKNEWEGLKGKSNAEIYSAFDADRDTPRPRLDPTKGEGQIGALTKQAEEYARALRPGDEDFKDKIVNRVLSKAGIATRVHREAVNAQADSIQEAINGPVGGKPLTSPDQLPDELKPVYENLPPKHRKQFDNQFKTNAREAQPNRAPTIEQYQTFSVLRSQAKDPDQWPAFSKLDMWSDEYNLTPAQRKDLRGMQDTAPKPYTVSRTFAINQISTMFDEKMKGKKGEKDERRRLFDARFMDELETMAGELKRTPTPDEIRALGSRLLTEKTTEDRYWFDPRGDKKEREFQAIPDAARQAAAAEGVTDEDEIRRFYIEWLERKQQR